MVSLRRIFRKLTAILSYLTSHIAGIEIYPHCLEAPHSTNWHVVPNKSLEWKLAGHLGGCEVELGTERSTQPRRERRQEAAPQV